MTPEMAVLIAQLLLKYGPGIAQSVASLFEKKEHTLQDWEDIFSKVKTYEQLDAESKRSVSPSASVGVVGLALAGAPA